MSHLYAVQILQPSLHNEVVLRLKPLSHGINARDEIDKTFVSRLYYNKGRYYYILQRKTIDYL